MEKMNKEIKYIKQRLEWLRELEKELSCFVRQIESKLKIIEKRLRQEHLNIPIPKLIILKMAKKEQETKLECLRCGNKWIPITKNPKVCPRCKSYQWDMPRIREKRKTVWDKK